MTRVAHYLNQFFAGVGGEDAAGVPPGDREGPVGPGMLLQKLLGSSHEVVVTVYCGDDYAASDPAAPDQILALARRAGAEALVAGPAFGSGRYGLACARLVALAAREGMPAVAAMHEQNPGIGEAGSAPVIACDPTARQMASAVETLSAAATKLFAGGVLGPDDGLVSRRRRVNELAGATAAERAVDLVLARLSGDMDATEIPLPTFDRVEPAAPVDPRTATVALLTEGALVPSGNPDRLESARATRWLRYPLSGRESVSAGEFMSVHGGFSTVAANSDPHRILPLDVARELQREGHIGVLASEYFVTVGNGTTVGTAQRFGVEWAAELRKSGVQAAILTST